MVYVELVDQPLATVPSKFSLINEYFKFASWNIIMETWLIASGSGIFSVASKGFSVGW